MKIGQPDYKQLKYELERQLIDVPLATWSKATMSDMWSLASQAGCLAWLYSTDQLLNDMHIETAFKSILKAWETEGKAP